MLYSRGEHKKKLGSKDILLGISYGRKKDLKDVVKIKDINGNYKSSLNLYEVKRYNKFLVPKYIRCVDEKGTDVGYMGLSVFKYCLLFILVIVLILSGLLFYRNEVVQNKVVDTETTVSSDKENKKSDIRLGELSKLSEKQKKDLSQKLVDESALALKVESRPIYRDNKLGVRVENNKVNNTNMRFKLFVKDEEIYCSDIIKPGYYIEYATLDRKINISDPAFLIFDCLNDDGIISNTSLVKIKIKEEGAEK